MRYVRARSAQEAADLAATDGTSILAGGTDLVTMRSNGLTVRRVVDIKGVDDLNGVEVGPSGTDLGATATMQTVAAECGPVPYLRGLAHGADVVGAPQTRRRATVGGNVCRASPAGDTLPALLALQADVHLRDAKRTWSIPLHEFFVGPGRTRLAPGQIVTGVHIPMASGASAYERFTYRDSLDLAMVGVAVAVEVSDGVCTAARVAIGGAGPTPLLAEQAGELLLGRPADSELSAAADSAAASCTPIGDVRGTAAFRRHAVSVLVRRIARRALHTAGVLDGPR